MYKHWFIVGFLILFVQYGYSQTTIVEWKFTKEDNLPTAATVYNSQHLFQHSHSTTFDYPKISSRFYCSTTGWNNGENVKYWLTSFSTLGCQNIYLSSSQYSSSTGPRDFLLQYSLNQTDWVTLSDTITLNDIYNVSSPFGKVKNLFLPPVLNHREIIYLRWLQISNIAINGNEIKSGGSSRIGDISIITTSPITPPIYDLYVNQEKNVQITPSMPCNLSWQSLDFNTFIVHIQNVNTNSKTTHTTNNHLFEYYFTETGKFDVWITNQTETYFSDTVTVEVTTRLTPVLQITPTQISFETTLNQPQDITLSIYQRNLAEPISSIISPSLSVFSIIKQTDTELVIRILSEKLGKFQATLQLFSDTVVRHIPIEAIVTRKTSGLFISEYIRGTGNNKALEFYNASHRPVNLEDFHIRIGTNGTSFASTRYKFTGNSTASSNFNHYLLPKTCVTAILNSADVVLRTTVENNGGSWFTSQACNFTGNDIVGLFYRDSLIDIIGEVNNLGENFSVGGIKYATYDKTLQRKSFIYSGNNDWKMSSGTNLADTEWLIEEQNVFTDLGKFTATDFDIPCLYTTQPMIDFGYITQKNKIEQKLFIITHKISKLEAFSDNNSITITIDTIIGTENYLIQFNIAPHQNIVGTFLDTIRFKHNDLLYPLKIPIKGEIIALENFQFISLQELQKPSLDGDRSMYEEQIVNTLGVITAIKGYNIFLQNGQQGGIVLRTDQYLRYYVGDSLALLNVKVTEYLPTDAIRSITQLTVTPTTQYIKLASYRKLPQPIAVDLKTLLKDNSNAESYESKLIALQNVQVTGYVSSTGKYYLQQDGYTIETGNLLFEIPELPMYQEIDITGICYYDKTAIQILPRNESDIYSMPKEEIRQIYINNTTPIKSSHTFYFDLPRQVYQVFYTVPKNCKVEPPSGTLHDFSISPQLKITLYTSNQEKKLYFVTMDKIKHLNVSKIKNTKIYPNPIVKQLFIDSENKISTIEVCDVSGNLVNISSPQSTHTVIDFKNQPLGFYYLKINMEDESFQVVKVLKK